MIEAPWLAISCASVALRCSVTMPLSIVALGQQNRLQKLLPLLAALPQDHRSASSVAQIKRLFRQNGFYPHSWLLPLAQIPVFIGASLLLRRELLLNPDHYKTGGLLWFTDLTAPDPTLLSPIILGLLHLVNFSVSAILCTICSDVILVEWKHWASTKEETTCKIVLSGFSFDFCSNCL